MKHGETICVHSMPPFECRICFPICSKCGGTGVVTHLKDGEIDCPDCKADSIYGDNNVSR